MKFYPERKVLYVDVDNTLVTGDSVNVNVLEWLHKKVADGYQLNLWSARGEEYARAVAIRHSLTDMFAHILAKPGMIVDDVGWSWARYTRAVNPRLI